MNGSIAALVSLSVLCALTVVALFCVCIWAVQESRKQSEAHEKLVSAILEDGKYRETALRDEVKALTESLVRAEGKFLVYPNRRPTEISEGWFDGAPKLVSAGPTTAADQALADRRKGGG